MAAPPIVERHLPHFHRRSPVKEAVRVATTASITIATALNVGDTIDGVVLADGDRVLVKDQTSGSQNGIYVAGATPARAYDQSTDDPTFGFLVYVIAGTTNGASLWLNTNAATPTIGTTALAFAQITADTSGFLTKTNGAGDTIMPHGSMGTTETFDPADGNVHAGTLDADCTVTLAAPTGADGATIEAWVTQDTPGGHALTFAAAGGGSFAWDGGAPTPDTSAGNVVRYLLQRIPGTTNDWVGVMVGGGTAVGALDDLSDVTITTPAENDTLRFVSGVWINDNRNLVPVTHNPGTGPDLVWDGDDLVEEWA